MKIFLNSTIGWTYENAVKETLQLVFSDKEKFNLFIRKYLNPLNQHPLAMYKKNYTHYMSVLVPSNPSKLIKRIYSVNLYVIMKAAVFI